MALFNITKIFKKADTQNLSTTTTTNAHKSLNASSAQPELIDLESIAAHDIVVLGSGCAKCHTLHNNVKEALKNLGKEHDHKIIHITDFAQIAACGVMTTPALMINHTIISTGTVLSVAKLEPLLLEHLAS